MPQLPIAAQRRPLGMECSLSHPYFLTVVSVHALGTVDIQNRINRAIGDECELRPGDRVIMVNNLRVPHCMRTELLNTTVFEYNLVAMRPSSSAVAAAVPRTPTEYQDWTVLVGGTTQEHATKLNVNEMYFRLVRDFSSNTVYAQLRLQELSRPGCKITFQKDAHISIGSYKVGVCSEEELCNLRCLLVEMVDRVTAKGCCIQLRPRTQLENGPKMFDLEHCCQAHSIEKLVSSIDDVIGGVLQVEGLPRVMYNMGKVPHFHLSVYGAVHVVFSR